MERAMGSATKDVERLTQLIRRSFNRLRAAADDLHGDLGVNASLRAVLEALYAGGEQTVPQIARDKSVSRQHIQKIVDALLPDGYVVERSNPDHKRSSLIGLTAKGRAVFEKMRAREAGLIAALAGQIPSADLAATLRVLAAVDTYLSDPVKGETV
jgi:DNA-binding MarR family transcriptional regulator